ncbi:hypothetical protein [Leptospira kanakyensis]|uniref:hypothetical protein n=1 Tax=Leptospira kanakyensis TaxID=2484968 RepID=UPI00223E433D|nr:hypothetical protein [Leptospira kanakyensis]MCW7470739.1 hypothetical protein [Leptospira kanakyensis]MCW7483198.1 hypothetical protein [Leptospira kanakyensis]
MKLTHKLTLLFCLLLVGSLSIGCPGESNDNNNTSLGLLALAANYEDPNTVCEKTIDETYTSGSYTALCKPNAGNGNFFRFENLKALGDNGYMYFFLGYKTAPTTTTPTLTGQYIFVVGKSVSSPNPYAWFRNKDYGNYQGGQMDAGANPTVSLANGNDVCISIGNSTATAPTVHFWATGVNGADCRVRGSLNNDNAVIKYSAWPDASNVLATTDALSAYFRISNTTLLTATKVHVSTRPIL